MLPRRTHHQRSLMQTKYRILCGLLMLAIVAGCTPATPAPVASGGEGIRKIKHVIIIMQENRSFDSYFGTYPGADGIPMKDGRPTVCVPNGLGGCVRPYHNSTQLDEGGAHGPKAGILAVNGGRMDGFIRVSYGALIRTCRAHPGDSRCMTLQR